MTTTTYVFVIQTSGDGKVWNSGTFSAPMTMTADCTAAQLAAEAVKHAAEVCLDDLGPTTVPASWSGTAPRLPPRTTLWLSQSRGTGPPGRPWRWRWPARKG